MLLVGSFVSSFSEILDRSLKYKVVLVLGTQTMSVLQTSGSTLYTCYAIKGRQCPYFCELQEFFLEFLLLLLNAFLEAEEDAGGAANDDDHGDDDEGGNQDQDEQTVVLLSRVQAKKTMKYKSTLLYTKQVFYQAPPVLPNIIRAEKASQRSETERRRLRALNFEQDSQTTNKQTS